jgi:hypothetical protein
VHFKLITCKTSAQVIKNRYKEMLVFGEFQWKNRLLGDFFEIESFKFRGFIIAMVCTLL